MKNDHADLKNLLALIVVRHLHWHKYECFEVKCTHSKNKIIILEVISNDNLHKS